MKILSFMNSKGGVGKTTLTLNIANALGVVANKKILIFDIDPQANLSKALLDNYESSNTIEKWFLNSSEEELIDSIQETKYENIFLVSAYNDLMFDTLNKVNGNAASELIFRQNLQKLEKALINLGLEHIFIDLFPTINKITMACLLACTDIIIPVEPHKFSFEGIQTLETKYQDMIEIFKSLNPEFKNNMKWILLNKVQKNKTHDAIVEIIKETFENRLLQQQIPLSTTRQKETMLMKFASLTEKNPISNLCLELIEKGVL